MISSGTLRVLREFWGSFGKLPLYDTGFDDAIKGSSAARAEAVTEALVAMAFLNGYAQCARLVCPYMGPSWRIAHTLSIIAGILTVRLQDDTFNVVEADRLIRIYTQELAELCRQKSAAPERGLDLSGAP